MTVSCVTSSTRGDVIVPLHDEAAFRAHIRDMLGLAPDAEADAVLHMARIETALGPMMAVSDQRHLMLLEFSERKALPGALRKLHRAARGRMGFGRSAPTDRAEAWLAAFFAGEAVELDVPLAPLGTPFTQEVWQALRGIPAGQTCTYSQLARKLNRPDAVRAVGRANGANPIAILIPCHRLVGADGNLTGYGGGLWRKRALIEHERRWAL